MKKFAKYTTAFLSLANFTLCAFNASSGQYTMAMNQFTIGVLFAYVYVFDNNLNS